MPSTYTTELQLKLHIERAKAANPANARAAIVYLFYVWVPQVGTAAITGGFSVSLRGCKRHVNHVTIVTRGLLEVWVVLKELWTRNDPR
jgi:alkylhydroperoxidase/carboxymuconolactone decarboxylase family protein YurZ